MVKTRRRVSGRRVDKGVLKFKTLDGIQFIRNVVVRIASPQNFLGIRLVNISDLATSKRC